MGFLDRFKKSDEATRRAADEQVALGQPHDDAYQEAKKEAYDKRLAEIGRERGLAAGKAEAEAYSASRLKTVGQGQPTGRSVLAGVVKAIDYAGGNALHSFEGDMKKASGTKTPAMPKSSVGFESPFVPKKIPKYRTMLDELEDEFKRLA